MLNILKIVLISLGMSFAFSNLAFANDDDICRNYPEGARAHGCPRWSDEAIAAYYARQNNPEIKAPTVNTTAFRVYKSDGAGDICDNYPDGAPAHGCLPHDEADEDGIESAL